MSWEGHRGDQSHGNTRLQEGTGAAWLVWGSQDGDVAAAANTSWEDDQGKVGGRVIGAGTACWHTYKWVWTAHE